MKIDFRKSFSRDIKKLNDKNIFLFNFNFTTKAHSGRHKENIFTLYIFANKSDWILILKLIDI